MAERIRKHRLQRGQRWKCIEEPREIARAIGRRRPGCDGVLVDCLTLWLSNIMLKEGRKALARRKAELLLALQQAPHPVVLVANEVGMGVVPDTAAGRLFRDELGRLNAAVAGACDEVWMCVAGIPRRWA